MGSPQDRLRLRECWSRNAFFLAQTRRPDPGLDGRDSELGARSSLSTKWHRSDATHIPTRRSEIVDKRTWIVLGAAEAICIAALVLAALVAGAVGASTT